MKESIEQGFLSRQSVQEDSDLHYYEVMHTLDYTNNTQMENITYLAKTDKDTMYLHQALKEPDRDNFIQAVIKEMNDHISCKHWRLIPVRIPKEHKILDAVWLMKSKRHLLTGEIYKWKAHLNIHGGQQEYAVNHRI